MTVNSQEGEQIAAEGDMQSLLAFPLWGTRLGHFLCCKVSPLTPAWSLGPSTGPKSPSSFWCPQDWVSAYRSWQRGQLGGDSKVCPNWPLCCLQQDAAGHNRRQEGEIFSNHAHPLPVQRCCQHWGARPNPAALFPKEEKAFMRSQQGAMA